MLDCRFDLRPQIIGRFNDGEQLACRGRNDFQVGKQSAAPGALLEVRMIGKVLAGGNQLGQIILKLRTGGVIGGLGHLRASE
jgi:hypothetical protein